MAQRTFLKIDGKESEIQSFHYELTRQIDDQNGEPTTEVQRCLITISKDSKMDKGSMITWMSKPDDIKEGTVTIYNDEKKEKKLKTITFKDSKIVQYSEQYNKVGNTNTIETFTISAELFSVDDAKFDFFWPKES